MLNSTVFLGNFFNDFVLVASVSSLYSISTLSKSKKSFVSLSIIYNVYF